MLGLEGLYRYFESVPVLCDFQELRSSWGRCVQVGSVGLAGRELGERSVGARSCEEDAWHSVAMVR